MALPVVDTNQPEVKKLISEGVKDIANMIFKSPYYHAMTDHHVTTLQKGKNISQKLAQFKSKSNQKPVSIPTIKRSAIKRPPPIYLRF